MILTLAALPALLILVAAMLRKGRALTRAAMLLCWLQMAVVARACVPLLTGQQAPLAFLDGFVIDRMAAFFVMLTTLVVAAAFTQADGFMERERHLSGHMVLHFYVFGAAFLVSMYGTLTADNLGYLWICMEASTLLSAPLVYFHRSPQALEAT